MSDLFKRTQAARRERLKRASVLARWLHEHGLGKEAHKIGDAIGFYRKYKIEDEEFESSIDRAIAAKGGE